MKKLSLKLIAAVFMLQTAAVAMPTAIHAETAGTGEATAVSIDLSDSPDEVPEDISDFWRHGFRLYYGGRHEFIPASVCNLYDELNDIGNVGKATIFAPTNTALASLPAAELAALEANPDEMCAFVKNHLVAGSAVTSDELETAVEVDTLYTGENSVAPSGNAYEGEPVTVAAGQQATGGTTPKVTETITEPEASVQVHVVDMPLLPVSKLVDIHPIFTDKTSPELSGTVSDPDAIVIVRVNGVPYKATNNGNGTWTLPAGTVTLNPMAQNTLFTAIARSNETVACEDAFGEVRDRQGDFAYPTEPAFCQQHWSGNQAASEDMNALATAVETDECSGWYCPLIAITMRRGVLSYRAGGVQGTDTTNSPTPAVVTPASVRSFSFTAGKGDGNIVAVDDGAVSTTNDSQDERQDETEDGQDNEREGDEQADTQGSGTPWYYWLFGIVTIAVIYYLLGGRYRNGPQA